MNVKEYLCELPKAAWYASRLMGLCFSAPLILLALAGGNWLALPMMLLPAGICIAVPYVVRSIRMRHWETDVSPALAKQLEADFQASVPSDMSMIRIGQRWFFVQYSNTRPKLSQIRDVEVKLIKGSYDGRIITETNGAKHTLHFRADRSDLEAFKQQLIAAGAPLQRHAYVPQEGDYDPLPPED